MLDRPDWSKMNVPARSSRQEVPVDDPSGDDETPDRRRR